MSSSLRLLQTAQFLFANKDKLKEKKIKGDWKLVLQKYKSLGNETKLSILIYCSL